MSKTQKSNIENKNTITNLKKLIQLIEEGKIEVINISISKNIDCNDYIYGVLKEKGQISIEYKDI